MRAIRNAAFAVITGFYFIISGAAATAQCPDLANHETAQDCPWAQASRDTAGVTDPAQLRAILDKDAPGFMAEMEHDGASPDLLSLWGLSRNIDESNLSTGTLTVPANLVQFFVSLWKVPYRADSTVGNAALNHTYGYLFSNVWTPFGFKRARYVRGELESGFGFTPGLFSGIPESGTLLSNLTYFIAKIAFRDNARSHQDFHRAVAKRQIARVSELVAYPYGALKVTRLVESSATVDYVLELRTDIVTFPKTNTQGSDQALLIYSLDFHPWSEPSRPRLITAFPVQTSFAAGIFDPKNLGDGKALKLNYNAALPVTVPAELMVGKRFIFDESKLSTCN